MKKLLVLMLSILMVLSLTACNKPSGGDNAEGKTLKISGLEGGYGKAGWEAVAKAFEEETGTKVELTLEKNISDVLRPAIQSGKDIPDLVYLAIGAEGKLTDTMIAEKQLVAIDDVLEMTVPGEEAKVSEKMLPGFTNSLAAKPYDDGKLYLAPINYTPCGLFYDANFLQTKGWEVPVTIEEFIALGEKAKAEGVALFTYPTTGYFDAFFSSLLNAVVGPEEYDKLMRYDLEAWKKPEVKKVFEIVGEIAKYTEENTVANANGEGFKKNQQLILDDKALFIPNGGWLPNEMADSPRADGFAWGFTAIPKYTVDGNSYSTTFTEQVWIPNGAQNIEGAKQFLAFIYSDKAAELFYKNGGAVIPSVNASSFIDDANTKAVYSVYDNGAVANPVGFVAHDSVEGIDLLGTLYESVNSVVNGDKSVDEWYDSVIKVIEAYQ